MFLLTLSLFTRQNAFKLELITLYIGVRDHFHGGGGGGTIYFARISHLCPKVEYVWAMHLCRTWEEGGEQLFEVHGIGHHRGEGEGVDPPPTVGTFWEFGY